LPYLDSIGHSFEGGRVNEPDDNDSNSDSSDAGQDYTNIDNSKFPNIDNIRNFLVDGAPFQNLRDNFRRFVYPNTSRVQHVTVRQESAPVLANAIQDMSSFGDQSKEWQKYEGEGSRRDSTIVAPSALRLQSDTIVKIKDRDEYRVVWRCVSLLSRSAHDDFILIFLALQPSI
jgi:hypothetical protein